MGIHTKSQLLAWDIANELGDKKHLGVYMKLAKRYDEFLLRQTLSECKIAFQKSKIEKKGAYFMACLKNKRLNKPL